LLTGASVRQWAAARGSELLGIVSWQRTGTATDRLWLAVPPDQDEIALAALLRQARSESPTRKTLRAGFPGRSHPVIETPALR
jgi:hypothetical protein